MSNFASYPSLNDSVVIITGGAAGIGASMVKNFCQQNSRVHFLDIVDDAANSLISQIKKEGLATPTYHNCDVRNIDLLKETIENIGTSEGCINVLVNNAANDTRHKFEDVTVEYWDERINLNLRHHFFAIQAVLPFMRSINKGSIVNLGSSSWRIGTGAMPGYTTSKAGVEGLTRSAARYVGSDNIRVNCVIPGWVMTERQQKLWLTKESEAELMSRQCLKTKLMPDDISRLVLWLSADDSALCTNQSYVVDGGRL